MARYIQFAKYTPQACAAVLDEGYVSRRQALEKYVAGFGGQLMEMYAVSSDEWDFAVVVELDLNPGLNAVHLLRAYGSGVIERSMTIDLATPEEADAARSSLPSYTPPGR